jgi:hypothetical protein
MAENVKNRKQQAIAATFLPSIAAIPVFFDRDGSADQLEASFHGKRVFWAPGAQRSNPIPTPPGVYLCSWIVTGFPDDTYRLRSGPQPEVTGGFRLKTLSGFSNEGTFEVVVL